MLGRDPDGREGLDFPNVTLVGLVAADAALAVPDFRAAERYYQLVAQVAGRAGRGQRPEESSCRPSIPKHRRFSMPWLGRPARFIANKCVCENCMVIHRMVLVRLLWRGESLAAVARTAETAVAALRGLGLERLFVLGPSEAGLAYLQGEHRWHCLLKGGDRRHLQRSARCRGPGQCFSSSKRRQFDDRC